MATKKTIELNFSENDRSVSFVETSSAKAEDNFKTLNFGGLIIEVKEKNKKPAAKPSPIKLNFDKSDEKTSEKTSPTDVNNLKETTKALEPEKEREETLICHETDDFVVISKPPVEKAKTPKIPDKPQHLRSNPVKQKQVSQSVEQQEELTGAAGLWAQEQAVEVPQVTEEDWEIFRKHMIIQPEPEIPCYDQLLEMNKFRLVKNHEEFVCALCEKFIKKGKGVSLKNCLHTFCRICLVEVIQKKHDKMGQVKCPMTVEACENIIDDEEIKDLLGDSYDVYILKVLQTIQDMIVEEEREEEAAKYAALPAKLNSNNLDLIENDEDFECTICYSNIEPNFGVILKNCLHSFCKECLIKQVKHSEDFTVICPNNDEHGSCKFTIQEREILKLVPVEIYEKHLELSLKQYRGENSETAFQCRTPNCRGFVEVDENVRGFSCQVCDEVNCIGCKAIHTGMNCQEYEFKTNPNAAHQRDNEESETAIKNMIAAGDAMYCPKCGIPVIKVDGCDYIICSTCKLGICWRTKKPRQPITKINGEVIDGCHCGENGVRCHPQCGNCH